MALPSLDRQTSSPYVSEGKPMQMYDLEAAWNELQLSALPSMAEKRRSTMAVAAEVDVALALAKMDEDDEESSTPPRLDSPLNWSYKYKMFIVILVSAMTMVDTFATLISIPAVPDILSEFDSTNQSYLVILVSIWELGEALGPFIVAPLSDIFGRLPVYHGANILFLLCTVGGALSNNLSMLVAFRFFNGFTIASLTLGPAMVGDMFKQDERGTAMAALYMGPLLGPVTAPIIGGYLAEAKGWRWSYWLIAIAALAIQIPSFICMRETSTRKLARSHRASVYGNEPRTPGKAQTAKTAVAQPLRFLFTCPVVLVTAVYTAVTYGYLNIILTTLTTNLESIYSFTEENAGLSFLGIGLGMVLGVVTCGSTSDLIMKRHGLAAAPEHRLLPAGIGGFLLPAGLLLYGWAMRAAIPWIVPLLGTALVGAGMMATVVQAESYLVDAFTAHSAPAIAAAAFVRALAGVLLPLAGPPLYDSLGLGGGNSLLAGFAVLLVPVPWLLMRYGGWARERWPVRF